MVKIDNVIRKAMRVSPEGRVSFLQYHLELQRYKEMKLRNKLEEVENNIAILKNHIAKLRENMENEKMAKENKMVVEKKERKGMIEEGGKEDGN